MSKIFLLALLVTLCLCNPNTYKLILHSKQRGAMCLDGSPAGMYLHEGTGKNKTKFLIYFYGGGFCGENTAEQTLDSCYFRSFTLLGTTKVYKEQKTFQGEGILSINPVQNPSFHDWTKIMAIYCDGGCHQGYRQQPLKYADTQLYFRGTRNVMEHFRYLDQKYDFYNGDTILVTGLSAGGIAVFQWANYVYQNAKKAKVYAMPDSGFFMTDYASPLVNGEKILAKKIKNLFNLLINQQSISKPQFSQPVTECLQSVGWLKGDYVKCFDPSQYANKLKPPMFIIESPIDQWCLKYILGSKCPTNRRSPKSLAKCSKQEFQGIQIYRKDVIKKLKIIRGQRKDIGGWGPSCVQHGFLSFPNPSMLLTSYRVPSGRGITLHDAISRFLRNPKKAPWYIQDVAWPNNRGCSGLPKNIRQTFSFN